MQISSMFAWILFINIGFELFDCEIHSIDKRFSFASNLDWYLNSLSTKSVDKKDEEDLLSDEPMMEDSSQGLQEETIGDPQYYSNSGVTVYTSQSSDKLKNDKHNILSVFSEGNCITSVKNEGRFKLTKDSKVPWNSANQCHLYIFAPVGKVINISFPSVNVDCDKSGVKIIDGITTLKNDQGQIDRLPYGASSRRPVFLCASSAKKFGSIISSQNYAQIDYKFEQSSDDATIDISFKNSNDFCDSMLTPDIEKNVYKLQSSKTRRTCRVYIAGSSIIRISNATLDPEVYDSSRCNSISASHSYLSLQVSNASWKPKPVHARILPCNTRFDRLILPCRFNVLELHSGPEASRYLTSLGILWKNSQSVQFSLQELPSKDAALFSRFCYRE